MTDTTLKSMRPRKVIALQAGKASREGSPGGAAVFHEFPDLPQLSFAQLSPADAEFETPELQEIFQSLLQDMPGSVAVFLIEGESGSGKSALLRRFRQGVPADWLLCTVRTRMALGEAHLLANLEKGFGRMPADRHALTKQLMSWAREGRVLVIAVDDAHKLSPFALKSLFSIKQRFNTKGLQLGIVLFATPAIETALATPSLAGLDESLLYRLTVPPFNLRQTTAYIQHYLSRTCADGPRPVFDSARLAQIQRRSRGLPKAINRLVDDLLSMHDRPSSAGWQIMARVAHYRTFFLSLAGFSVLLGGVYLGFLSVGGGSVPQTTGDTALSTTVDRGMSGAELPAIEPPPIDTVITNEPATRITQSPAMHLPAPHKPAPPPRPAAITPPRVSSSPAPGTAATIVVPAAAMTRTAKVVAPPLATQPSDSHWLQQQDSSYFTVQLTRWSDKNKAIRYIRDKGIMTDAAYIHTRSKGRDWYLVVYRTYPSLTAARQAIKGLPGALRKYGPWVRNISALKSSALFD